MFSMLLSSFASWCPRCERPGRRAASEMVAICCYKHFFCFAHTFDRTHCVRIAHLDTLAAMTNTTRETTKTDDNNNTRNNDNHDNRVGLSDKWRHSPSHIRVKSLPKRSVDMQAANQTIDVARRVARWRWRVQILQSSPCRLARS